MMIREPAQIVEKISGNFLCVFGKQSAEFGEIVITLAEWKTPIAKLSNETWEKEHEKQFGAGPSFF